MNSDWNVVRPFKRAIDAKPRLNHREFHNQNEEQEQESGDGSVFHRVQEQPYCTSRPTSCIPLP